MSVLYVVLPVSLLIAGGFVVAFVWAVRSAQYDDTETPALRMLADDEDAEARAGKGESEQERSPSFQQQP